MLKNNQVTHWYDFTCPFCYVGQSRNLILKRNGFKILALPFQAHPDVPPEGLFMGKRAGDMYIFLEKEAIEAGLPLNWPMRLPNSRKALAVAEFVRIHFPEKFDNLEHRLFAAHFQFQEDLGSIDLIQRCVEECQIGSFDANQFLGGPHPFELVSSSENLARGSGVRGTPAWIVHGNLVSGLQPTDYFEQLVAF